MKTVQPVTSSTLKKFKSTSQALSLVANSAVNSSLLDNSILSNTSSPQFNFSGQSIRHLQNKYLTNFNNNGSTIINHLQTNTPVKQMSQVTSEHNILKGQTPGASSFSLSSPSAAIFFGLNSNSFSVPGDMQQHSASVTPRMSKSEHTNNDLKSNTSATNYGFNKENKQGNLNLTNTNTSMSNIDDVIIDAFMNDFSYEIVQK